MIPRISQSSLRLLAASVFLLSLPSPLAGATGQAIVTITCRAVDTRNPAGSLGGPALGANETRIFTIAGTCGVPADALGLAVNLTVVAPAADGYAQLYAGDAAAPPTQVLSFSAGRTRASNAMVALASDASGTIALANVSGGPADFIIDIAGYWVPACTSTITVTPDSLPNGIVGTGYSQTVTASGSAALPFTYSVTAGSLPTNLLLNATTGVISGTPTAAGTFTFTVTATDAKGCTGTTAYTVEICLTPTITPVPAAVCATSAGNQASGPAGAATYAWTIANGTITSAANIQTITYTSGASGAVSLNLTTTTATGCSASTSASVTINPIPATPTAANNGPICAGSTLNLMTPTVASATYSWTGPNSFTSSAQNPSIPSATTAASGTYSVTMTVNGCTSAAGTTSATVNATPATPTAANNGPICAGSTLNLTTPTVASATYSWTGPNAFSSAAQNPSIPSATTAATGTYSVTVTVGGCTSAAGTTTATVNANPATPAITPVPAAVCASSTGNQASGPIGAAAYAWSIVNGTITSASNIQTITYTAGASGNVTLSLTVTNASGCLASNNTLVTINPNPATPPILTSNPQTFTVTGGAGTFTLTFNGQTTSSLAFNATALQVQAALNALSSVGGAGGSVVVSLSAGVYTVAFGGTLTGPQPLLTALGAGGCTVVVAPPAVCADSAGNLASGPAGATTYAWTIVNGTITSAANIQTITYTAGSSGSVTLNLTVTNGSGCSANNSAIVTINPSPATPAITAPASVCELSTGNLASGPAGATTYAWTISNGTITSASNVQNITFTAGAFGTPVVLGLTITNASGCSASNSTNVTVNANPTPTITPVPAAVCASSTGNQASGPAGVSAYAWSIGNGTITSASNIQTITYTAGASGSVTLNLTVTNGSGCLASSSAVITINPNPATPAILTSNPQTFTVTGGAGTFTLTFNGQTTSSLAFNATAAQVQAALTALSSIGGVGGSVLVSLSAGVYTVAFGGGLGGPQPLLTALGAGGCTVVVSPPSVCADTTGNLASGPAGATTYAWTISGGTITSAANIQTITYTAGSSGSVTLNLTVTNASGCSANNSAIVTINLNPATPAITAPGSVCDGSTGNAASGPAGATTYAWTISNGTITSASDIQNITFTAGASGTTLVLNLTVTNASGCSASNSTNITVNPSPATPTITPTPATVCANIAGNTASGPLGATTYAWTISGGSITSATTIQTITYTAGASGSVTLNLTVTNGSGCSASNSAVITINPNPTLAPAPGALTSGTFGVPYSQTFTPSAGSYTFSISPVTPPFGLSFNTSLGVLSGTPTSTGLNTAFSITATNSVTGCSVTQAYTLTVKPNAVAETFNNAVGNTQLVVTGSCPSAVTTPNVCHVGSVLANDSGPAALSAGPGVIATTGGGSVAMSANGTFTYTPAIGFTGADTFTYQLTDGNGVTNTAVDTINVASRVWYVNGAGGAGDGRSNTPFNSLASASTAHSAGDVIFVESVSSTSTPGLITLKANVVLWGQGTNLPAINGSTILNTGATSKPNLTNTVTVGGAGVTISSLDISTGAATGLSATGALGTLTIENGVTVTTTSGTAASFSSATGTVNANTTSLAATSGTAFSADLGTADFNWGGTISSATGRSISVTNRTGGTATFSGAVSGTGTGIFLNLNTLSTNTFTGAINLSTGGNPAFTATGGGTVTATDTTSTLATTTGTALNVANTTIGASNLTFRSISSNGAVNGIVLNSTGASGRLSVVGNGGTCTSLASSCSGGTIQATSSHGISLTNTKNPSFSFMKVTNVANSGIFGTAVTNFTLANSVIDGVNTSHTTTDGDVAFNLSAGGSTETNVSGAVSITNNTLNNSWQDGISINNYAGTISNLTITGNSLTSNSTFVAGSAGTAIKVLAQQGAAGAQITTGSISGNTINNFPGGGGIIVHGGSTAALPAVNIGSLANPVVIDDNVITGFTTGLGGIGTNGIELTIGHLSTGYFTVGELGHGNTITNVAGDGIACSLFGTGTEKCSIAYNTIDANNTAGSPGINTGADSATANTNTPTLYLDIHNNNVQHTQGSGILSTIRSTDGTGIFKIENNSVTNLTSTGLQFGIRVDSGNGTEATGAHVCLKIDGNTAVGHDNASHTILDPGIGLRQQHAIVTSSFQIDGLSPSPANDAQMEAYVGNAGQNPGCANGSSGNGATGVLSISGGATFQASTCTIP